MKKRSGETEKTPCAAVVERGSRLSMLDRQAVEPYKQAWNLVLLPAKLSWLDQARRTQPAFRFFEHALIFND